MPHVPLSTSSQFVLQISYLVHWLNPLFFCRGHSARLQLLLHEPRASWASQWLPWDHWTPTAGSSSSCFPYPEQSISALCRTSLPLSPSTVMISFTEQMFQGNILTQTVLWICKVYFSAWWKGVIIVPRPLLGKGKKRKVAQWGSINTVLAVRQWSTGGKSPFFSLPSPAI